MKLKKFLKSILYRIKRSKQVKVGDFNLTAVADHSIQENLDRHKYYSRNLPRLAKYLETKYPVYNIIDVGANIGDTAALLRTEHVKQQIYAIEGEPLFFALLQKNMRQFTDVSIYKTYLGEYNHVAPMTMEVQEGTARLNLESNKDIAIKKLDDLAMEEGFKNVKLLKIDTDGYDFKILRGGFKFIEKYKPVVFFEYDADYLEEQGEHGTAIFEQLHALGYSKLIYYDNYGKLLLSATTGDKQLIGQLYQYMRKKEGAFQYYDVCAFHGDDDTLADDFISKEMAFFS